MRSSTPREPLRDSQPQVERGETVLPGDVASPVERTTSDTVVGAAAATPEDGAAATSPEDQIGAGGGHRAQQTGPEPTPVENAPIIDDVTVKPQSSDRDVGRAKADEIDQLIDISDILKPPPRPVALYAIAAALFVAGLAWALVGGGVTEQLNTPPSIEGTGITVNGVDVSPVNASTAIDPIEIDLIEPILVGGVPSDSSASIDFEQFGIPIGTATTESSTTGVPLSDAELDPGFIGRITSGAIDATLVLEGPDGSTTVAAFDVIGTNPWFLSAAGVISVILLLFGVASIESYLRAFRRGRSGAMTFVGLLVGGAILGASAAVACTVIFGTPHGVVAIAGPAALCAAGAVALGLAARANRKRRRAARQELRHTAINALARSGR